MVCPRSSSRGRNTSASVTVTVFSYGRAKGQVTFMLQTVPLCTIAKVYFSIISQVMHTFNVTLTIIIISDN